jgi:hypothetical protein
MIDPIAVSGAAIGEAVDAAGEITAREPDFPPALLEWLARLRLLERVPFHYLVPHEEMLPLESIRFFYLNRDFLDAAVDGALSLGGTATRDRAHLESVYAELRDAIDAQERKLWAERTNTTPEEGAAEVVTGFLLRSRAVSGWPSLHVRAYRKGSSGTDEEVRPLRLERLAPAVLLAVFDGVPTLVEVEEPRSGVQFGVDPAGPGDPADSRWATVRLPATGQPKTDPQGKPVRVRVPFRPGAPGVIDVTALGEKLRAAGQPELGTALEPAELALQLMQYPYRQPFGETSEDMDDVFEATVDIKVVRQSQEL